MVRVDGETEAGKRLRSFFPLDRWQRASGPAECPDDLRERYELPAAMAAPIAGRQRRQIIGARAVDLGPGRWKVRADLGEAWKKFAARQRGTEGALEKPVVGYFGE